MNDLIIQKSQAGNRLDKFLCTQFGQSRNFFKNLIDEGSILINGTLSKPSYILKEGDMCTIALPTPAIQSGDISQLGISIIFENSDFAVLNKPAGVLVHPTSHKQVMPTVVDWLKIMYSAIHAVGAPERPGIVHRLDKDTSGILLVAKTQEAYMYFTALFKDRKIHKKYLAVVSGAPEPEGYVDFKIERDRTQPQKMTHKYGSGRVAATYYMVKEYFKDAALTELRPITGRTHQLRVHMAGIGHPIMGDTVYGTASSLINRQALHASEIAFTYNEQEFSFVCELPNDIKEFVKNLRK